MYIQNRKDTKIQGWYVCALCINQPGILSYCNHSISLGSSFHGGLSRQIQLTQTALTHTMSHCVAYLNHECHLAKCWVVNCTPVLHTNTVLWHPTGEYTQNACNLLSSSAVSVAATKPKLTSYSDTNARTQLENVCDWLTVTWQITTTQRTFHAMHLQYMHTKQFSSLWIRHTMPPMTDFLVISYWYLLSKADRYNIYAMRLL